MSGFWSNKFALGIVAIHVVHLSSGKVLMWSYDHDNINTTPSVRVWDPTGQPPGWIIAVPNEHNNMFCAGHAQVWRETLDGARLVGGGHTTAGNGTNLADIFHGLGDPPTWEAVGNLVLHRWYPTITTDHRGDAYIWGGEHNNSFVTAHEFFNVTTKSFILLPTGSSRDIDYYPYMYMLPKPITIDNVLFPAGSWFCAGPRKNTAVLKVTPSSGVWSENINSSADIWAGSSAMYQAGKIIKCGGVGPSGVTGITEIIDITRDNPQWRDHKAGNPNDKILMNFPRKHHVLIVGPEGKIYAFNGEDNNGNPVLTPEVFDPDTEEWTLLTAMNANGVSYDPRMYHSVAFLYYDCKVFCCRRQRIPDRTNVHT